MDNIVTIRQAAVTIAKDLKVTANTVEGWLKDGIESGRVTGKNIGTSRKKRYIVDFESAQTYEKWLRQERSLRRGPTNKTQRIRALRELLRLINNKCVDEGMETGTDDQGSLYVFAKNISDMIEKHEPDLYTVE